MAAAGSDLKTSIQFVKGTSESCVPDVKLTRARDGASGTATFFFEQPDVFEAGAMESAGGDITGLYLVDEEGTLSTVDVSAKFVNGKPKGIEARYNMKSVADWNRFMRFMERYAEDHGARPPPPLQWPPRDAAAAPTRPALRRRASRAALRPTHARRVRRSGLLQVLRSAAADAAPPPAAPPPAAPACALAV